MATFVPPKKNDAAGFTFYTSLAPRTAAGIWQASPTLAAGDVKIAIDDGAPANLGTLPAVDADFTKRVKVVLSQAETNGDNLTIIFNDAAGAEWCDKTINIQTVARQIDDLAYPTTSGRSIDVDASGGVEVGSFQAGAITAAAIATDAIDADAIADNAINAAAIATGAITAAKFAAGAIDAAALAADAGTEIATAVWASGTRTLTALDEDSTTIDLDATIQAANDARFDALDAAVADLPTNAELTTALGTADDAVLAQIALVKAQTDLLPSDPADASVIAGRFDTLDTSIADLPTNAELTTALASADDAVLAQVALVKAKTDSLTFTVAGEIDANIQSVNDVTVTGDGQTGTEWGPA